MCYPAFTGFTTRRQLADWAQRADGSRVALSELTTCAQSVMKDHTGNPKPPLLALAGIAQPEAFFAMLRAKGVPLEHTLSLPDNHEFNITLLNEYLRYSLICTEKDAVKLWPFRPDALAVPLICTLSEAFYEQLDARIHALKVVA